MTALKLWCLGDDKPGAKDRDVQVTGHGLLPVGEFLEGGKTISAPNYDLQISTCLYSCILNSTAELKVLDDPAKPDSVRSIRADEANDNFEEFALRHHWVAEGNSSEVPLVVLAGKAGILQVLASEQYPSIGARACGKLSPEVPFSSERKLMVSVVHADEEVFGLLRLPPGCKHVVLVKGAPNYLLENCNSAIFHDQSFGALNDATKKRIMTAVDDLSAQALRVLAVAIRPMIDLPYDPADPDIDAFQKFQCLNTGLTFVGLVASLDREREGVVEAIHVARDAGVKTVMITGDYLKTAVAIAKNIDLITMNDDPAEVAVDCQTLRPSGNEYLPPQDFDEITSRCVVFARAQPEDKLQIVRSLQRQGFVTCMTGDGVNDAPALKEADIGVAMGINGTEVAKAASAMILLDDNFVTIVAAIRKGRQLYRNIQKFVTYLLGANICQVFLILCSVFVGFPIPFQPLVLLFLNISIDGTTAMSISVQPAEEGIMKLKPRPRKQPLIISSMWLKCIGHAICMSAAVLTTYLIGLHWHIGGVLISDILPEGHPVGTCSVFQGDGTWREVHDHDCVETGMKMARTMAFITISFSEVLHGLSVKSDAPMWLGVTANKALLLAMTISGGISLFLLLTPGVSDLFGFAGMQLEYWDWLLSFALVVATVGSDELMKYWIHLQHEKLAKEEQTQEFYQTVMMELRQLRHHIINIENTLNKKELHPPRRVQLQESVKALAYALTASGLANEEVHNYSKRLKLQEQWAQSSFSLSLHHLDGAEDSV